MLIVHHLRRSQSERIVWLCEELGIDYELRAYDRDPTTQLAPAEYKALHFMGTAPVIDDGGVVLAESNAVVAYILAKHGSGRLEIAPSGPDYAQYLYWLHFANGTLQPAVGRRLFLQRLPVADDDPIKAAMLARVDRALAHLEARLGHAPFLAGGAFTAADLMNVFSLTTMRVFAPLDLSLYPRIREWLERIGARPAYLRAMEKGDPGFTPRRE